MKVQYRQSKTESFQLIKKEKSLEKDSTCLKMQIDHGVAYQNKSTVHFLKGANC